MRADIMLLSGVEIRQGTARYLMPDTYIKCKMK